GRGGKVCRAKGSGLTRTRAMVSSPPMTARRTSSSTTPPSRLTATAASRTTSGSNTPSPGATRARGPSRFARFETTTIGRETGVRESLLATPDCRTRRLSVTEFYGIQTGTIPGFAEAGGGTFMSVQGLPDQTVENMVTFMEKLRGMHAQDSLAFEVCLRHVASVIEDQ